MSKGQKIANHLDTLVLSSDARWVINSTGINDLPEVFDGTETAEEVEAICKVIIGSDEEY